MITELEGAEEVARLQAVEVIEGRKPWAHLNVDCLDLLMGLPDRCVDHVLTDPPYSEHVHGKQKRQKRKARTPGQAPQREEQTEALDLGFEALTADDRYALAAEYARLARRWVLVKTDVESCHLWRDDLEEHGLRHDRQGAWIKLGAQPRLNGQGPAAWEEAIEVAHQIKGYKGVRRWNGGGKGGLWSHLICRGADRWHPTQMPIGLALELVEDFTDPGELVLDTHAGSAVIGVACIRLGRRYIGIERDTKHGWYRRGLAWLEAEVQGFTLAAAEAGQLGLFSAVGGK